MKIIVDLLGADAKPLELLDGVVKAVKEIEDLEVVVFGNKKELDQYLNSINSLDRILVYDATEEITNDDQPTVAIKTKKDSSLVKSLELLKADDSIDAFISAGNTGAVLFGSIVKLGRIDGLDRPALAPLLPTDIPGKSVCLIDSGANVDCKPEYLAQFALMGSNYVKQALGIENPKVALVSVGVEDKKGNEQTKAAFALMKQLPINFVGNMEAREALSGNYDVVVCDGFIGNVLLKSTEGAARMVINMFASELKSNLSEGVDPLTIKTLIGKVMAKLDFNSNGGAALLGVNKTVVKMHGSSNGKTVLSTIKQVKKMVDGNVSESLKKLLSLANIND